LQDNCRFLPNSDGTDTDRDGVVTVVTTACVNTRNPYRENFDQGEEGDACDGDFDGDTVPNVYDTCPFITNENSQGEDSDNDELGNICDNCPFKSNRDQVSRRYEDLLRQ
jgi:syndecan 4